jgi:hypothetical protein
VDDMALSKKPKSNKKGPLNLGGIICLTTAIYFIYYLLAQNILPGSVSSLLSWNSDSATRHWSGTNLFSTNYFWHRDF